MLKRISTILWILIFSISVFILDTNANNLPLLGKIIFVDAGHGGRDPGTYYGNIYEKDINLEIALKLKSVFESNGAIVHMSRESDIDLSSKWDNGKKRGDLYRRIMLMKKVNADLYLSIHLNWYQYSYVNGAEVLYNDINKDNYRLASIMMDYFKSDLGSKRKISKTNLYMYNNTRIPGVLIECGYLSNAKERKILQSDDYQLKLANVINKGVIKYFNEIM